MLTAKEDFILLAQRLPAGCFVRGWGFVLCANKLVDNTKLLVPEAFVSACEAEHAVMAVLASSDLREKVHGAERASWS